MSNRLFVLDSNVLMHDPTCLFRFQEHDLYVPMMVLEELDHNKKGRSEVARNARQASRFMDEIMSNMSQEQIEQGLPLNIHVHDSPNGHVDNEKLMGRLFFQTVSYRNTLPEYLPGNLPDNNILGTTLALKKEFAQKQVTLVTKDINLRIKAAVLGIHAEDYHNDKVLEDVDLLYTGSYQLSNDFWE
ncbi:MAG: PIN domain-containing protein, partial [Thiohalomonadales bacterium]|nr:PIN domain-containing protein [Thiohalomonadales bacterium]